MMSRIKTEGDKVLGKKILRGPLESRINRDLQDLETGTHLESETHLGPDRIQI